MSGTVHLRRAGEGPPLVLLPPAPHTGGFFDTFAPKLPGVTTLAADYPGYGGSAALTSPSIEAYADALVAHMPDGAALVGFHTGTLVAAEIAKRAVIAGIVMIDVPYFDAQTRHAYATKMEATPRNAAFHAAFAYDPQAGLRDLPCPVRVIATRSVLHDLTCAAAAALSAPLTERMDVGAPVFEDHGEAMAAEIVRALGDMARETG